ncbi:alpha/beta fold hydrolase [Vibrio furnissii]|uniref:alpha/beta fold hydrolase n=1 Tax=Vibrio furnissii TaxID=29494 RepID=UPI002573E823|nr:alpha/beta hydrolase [Vibrio furnissii]WJG22499.1 alpha/beta hydrolase [Vibrio furnissii]
MLQARSYRIAEGRLAALEMGSADTAEMSLIFVHGWLDNAASFQTVMRELHRLNPDWHLCAIDLPGHGHSDHKSGHSFYPFHDYIDDIYQLLVNFSSNRRVLVGHSLGALIASCYSAAFPDQVAGLVQIEGFGPLAESPALSVQRLRHGVMSRQRIRRKPERGYASLEQALDRRVAANQIAAELLAPIVERGIALVGDQWRWRHDSKLKSDSLYRMSWEHAQAVLAEIRCPQRIILGDQGFQHLQHDRRILPNDRLEMFTIPGGHHCHLEQPSCVAELIFGLVNKI